MPIPTKCGGATKCGLTVNRDHLGIVRAADGAADQPADAAEAIDADWNRSHLSSGWVSLVSTTRCRLVACAARSVLWAGTVVGNAQGMSRVEARTTEADVNSVDFFGEFNSHSQHAKYNLILYIE